MDLIIKRVRKVQGTYVKRIKWYSLKEEEKRREFKERVLDELSAEKEGVQEWWQHNSKVMRTIGKDVLSETSGRVWEDKEGWWWSDEIQETLRSKKEAKK